MLLSLASPFETSLCKTWSGLLSSTRTSKRISMLCLFPQHPSPLLRLLLANLFPEVPQGAAPRTGCRQLLCRHPFPSPCQSSLPWLSSEASQTFRTQLTWPPWITVALASHSSPAPQQPHNSHGVVFKDKLVFEYQTHPVTSTCLQSELAKLEVFGKFQLIQLSYSKKEIKEHCFAHGQDNLITALRGHNTFVLQGRDL